MKTTHQWLLIQLNQGLTTLVTESGNLIFFLIESHNEFCFGKRNHETEFCLAKINLKQLLLVETFSLQEKKPGLTFHLATNFMNINSSKVVVLLSGSTVRPQVERFSDPEKQYVYKYWFENHLTWVSKNKKVTNFYLQ